MQSNQLKGGLMRIQLWLAAFLGLILLLYSGARVSAQYGNGRPSVYQPQPRGEMGWSGGVPASSGESWPDAPPKRGIIQNGLGNWPDITPFLPRFEQHYRDDGLWFERHNNRLRQYFLSFQYLDTKVREAKGLIGDPRAQSYKGIVLDETPFAPSADDFQGDALDFSTGVGEFPQVGLPGENLFDARRMDNLDNVMANGFKLAWGFTDADGSGLVVEFWHNGRDDAVFDAGEALTFRRQVIQPGLVREIADSAAGFTVVLDPFGDPIQILQRNLLNLSGIPVDDGTVRELTDGTTLGGTTIAYDIAFQLIYRSESAGATFDLVRTPLIDKGPFRLRAMFGGRYVYLNDLFKFEGEDSGLYYDDQAGTAPIIDARLKLHPLPNLFDDDDDGVTDPAAVADEAAGVQQSRFVRLDLVAGLFGLDHPGRYRAFLKHELFTHLSGPQVGITYDLGGEHFKLTGKSKVGLMINYERLELSGDNIGDANNIGEDIDFAGLTATRINDSPIVSATPDNRRPNAFFESESHVHVSPLLEQSIMVEVPVFRHLPLFRRYALFDQATFNAGWSITWIGEVARPAQSILWTANPRQGLFPQIKIDRDEWYTSHWSFGVNFPY